MARWSDQQFLQAVQQQAARQRVRVNPRLILATAKVESGLDPGAVGDGGTSFGFLQNHVGGAGGRTLAEARRFLNPQQSISNAVRRFAGAQTPQDAYGVQRPADRESYIRKVSAALNGGSAALNAPVSGVGGAGGGNTPGGGLRASGAVGARFTPQQQAVLSRMFQGKPAILAAMSSLNQQPEPADPVTGGAPTGPVPGGGGKGIPKGADYRWLQRMGQSLFGLRNDPGIAQTYGGGHTRGSEHYDRRAIDFGTAKNTPQQLAQWVKWARARGLDVLNEGDHIHVSLPGSGV